MNYLSLTTLVLTLVMLASACGDPLQPREQVAQLRVLGIKMDPPDAIPGQKVELSALVVDPNPGEWTTTWYVCPKPISMGEYFTGTLDTERGLCPEPYGPYGDPIGTGLDANFEIIDGFLDAAVEELVDAGLSNEDEELDAFVAFFGWHLRVNLVAERVDGAERIEAHKRLLVTAFGGYNTNPAPPTLDMQQIEEDVPPEHPDEQLEAPPDGRCLSPASATATVVKKETYLLTPTNLPATYEMYAQLSNEGELEELPEQYWFSWFSTVKGFDSSVTDSGKPENPFNIKPPDDEVLPVDEDGNPYIPLWVVIRDGRGGTSWCEEKLPYSEPVPEQ